MQHVECIIVRQKHQFLCSDTDYKIEHGGRLPRSKPTAGKLRPEEIHTLTSFLVFVMKKAKYICIMPLVRGKKQAQKVRMPTSQKEWYS